ncbi:hypothetical protein P3L10_028652 [Capsicum annuum]|uniref:uncharacterized protein LOC124888168 n=1 Tax=Capsicum annuum TaxID=4072 RepID=UPI001FB0672D|nr:uncharacterized protein LOC124888168 [Capsicum annuum]
MRKHNGRVSSAPILFVLSISFSATAVPLSHGLEFDAVVSTTRLTHNTAASALSAILHYSDLRVVYCINVRRISVTPRIQISNSKRREVHLGLVLKVDSQAQVPQLIHRISRSQDIQLLLVSSSLLRSFSCHIQSLLVLYRS